MFEEEENVYYRILFFAIERGRTPALSLTNALEEIGRLFFKLNSEKRNCSREIDFSNLAHKKQRTAMEFHELEKDPWCDEANPRKVDFEQARKDNFPQFFFKKINLKFFSQISAAAYRIRDGIVRTPCDVF